ncbi:hypothetical protein [Pollutibacter soli]|uniref:hypothetical protein n=1 Tax=Pollutibacter soli TaxID=3034157 RepID=UPI003013BB15
MKRLLICMLTVFISGFSFSQTANSDSVTAHTISFTASEAVVQKQQSIEKKKLELAGLEKQLNDQATETKAAVAKSNEAVADNASAARALQKNAPEKKYSKRAYKAAREARKSSKRARIALKEEKSLEKKIRLMKKSIQKEEKQLEKLLSETRQEGAR